MEVFILGAILQYMVSASFKLFLMVGKGLTLYQPMMHIHVYVSWPLHVYKAGVLFQGANNRHLCIYRVGTWSSVLIREVSLIEGCPLTLYQPAKRSRNHVLKYNT